MNPLFWRRRPAEAAEAEQELGRAKERLESQRRRWPQVRRAEASLDRLIRRAARGGI